MIRSIFKFFNIDPKDKDLLELLKGGGISMVLKVIGGLSGFLFTFLVSRFMGVDVWGIFTLCYTIILIASIIGRFGLDMSLLRYVAEFNASDRRDLIVEAYKKGLFLSGLICLFLTLIIYLFSDFIAGQFFHKSYLSRYFAMASFGILPMAITVLNAGCLRGMKNIRAYSFFVDAGNFLFASLFFILLYFLTVHVSVPIIAFLSGLILAAILSTSVWVRQLKLKKREFIQYSVAGHLNMKNIIYDSTPMMLASSMIMLLWWTDTIMLGIMKSEVEVGIYNVSLKIATVCCFVLSAVGNIAAPKFVECYKMGDLHGLRRISQQSVKIIMWTTLPAFILILIFSSHILSFFTGAADFGTATLIILACGLMLDAFFGLAGLMLQMTGKQMIVQNILLLSVLLNIVLNLTLIPEYSYTGAAIASALGLLFKNLSCLWYVKKYFNLFIFPFNATWIKGRKI